MLAKLNRNQRLQRASDPATPVEELLRLALEFPDTVAANPTLTLAVTADPGVLRSADPVALACIITSPDAPAPLAQAIETIALRTLDKDVVCQLRDYLEQWRACGCSQPSVDLTRLAPASNIPLTIEQGIRGRAVLLQRLGRDTIKCELNRWERGAFSGVLTPASGEYEVKGHAILQLDRAPTLGGITDACIELLNIYSEAGQLRADLEVQEQVYEGFILAEFHGPQEPFRCHIEGNSARWDEDADISMPTDTAMKVDSILGPWRSAAKALPKGHFLVIDRAEVKCGTPSEVRLALLRGLSDEDDADIADDEDCETMPQALSECVSRYSVVPGLGNGPFLVESLPDAPIGADVLGGFESIKDRLESLVQLFPNVGPNNPGMCGESEYEFVIMDGNKYAALFAGPVGWLHSLHSATVELDPMN